MNGIVTKSQTVIQGVKMNNKLILRFGYKIKSLSLDTNTS